MVRFQDSLEQGCLLESASRVLVGVSGGGDSTALLLLFAELRDALGPGAFPELLAGHVHHGLRGAEADVDEHFVRELAASRRVTCLVERGDAREVARRRKLSPEAAARSLRYDAYRRWAVERGCDAIALAHTLDDQAETVLLRAVRGCGLRGLAGIPRQRLLVRPGRERRQDTSLIRPLLDWRRRDLLEYLADRRQPYRTDLSNLDLNVPRNRVRHEILGLLEAVHPGAAAALARLGAIAGGLQHDLEGLGELAFIEARREVPAPAGIVLDVGTLRRWPAAVVYEALCLALARAVGQPSAETEGPASPPRLPSKDFLAILQRLRESPGRAARIELGESATAGKSAALDLRYGLLKVVESLRPAARAVHQGVRFDDAGTAEWYGWRFAIAEAEAPPVRPGPPGAGEGGAASTMVLEERLDAGSVVSSGPLGVRAWRHGDRFHPLGAPGSKKLKEYFRSRRVWPDERGAVPLLVAGERIAWVVGHGIAHPFRVLPDTRQVLAVKAMRPDLT